MASSARVAGHDYHRDGPYGALFLDCDITCLAPLPFVDPAVTKFGVCPHRIAEADELLFGRYNGGWVYASDPECIFRWKMYSQLSRYFDQSSLEDVVQGLPESQVVEFGSECNFGYWRMFQAPQPAAEIAKRFSLESAGAHPVIQYQQRPLQSVHTHFHMKHTSKGMELFNRLLRRWITRCCGTDDHPYRSVLRALS